MTKVLYMTWGEVPRMSSVYGGQVVRVTKALQDHPEIEDAFLLAGYPIIHSGHVREKFAYKEEIAKIESLIGHENFIQRRLPVPPVGIYPKKWQMSCFFTGQIEFVASVIRELRPDVVQCRSYLATRAALLAREKHGFEYRIFFDARSLLPDEAVILGRWEHESSSYLFWKEIERHLLTHSDHTLSVSKPMQRHLDKLGAKASSTIYLNVDVEGLDFVKMQDNSRLDTSEPVLAYVGYLDQKGWHDPEKLWSLFASFHSHCAGAKLTVITKSNHEQLKQSAVDCGFEGLLPSIRFDSASSPSETVAKLADCDISLFGYRDPRSKKEAAMAESVFATKTAEYLCAGLPVIVNKVCGGARDYVLERGVGIAYCAKELLSSNDVDTVLQMARNRKAISDRVRSDFALKSNADRLVKLYQKALR